jgi:two-component system CheB/CheR fusion protein
MTPEDQLPDPLGSENGSSADAPPTAAEDWAPLLGYLRTARGFDFHGYKSTSLARRIQKRMAALGIESYGAYQDYLEVHQDEFPILFNTILINVTACFRDPEAWEVIRTAVVPQILADKAHGGPIRAWSAGCASGEEAYTLAIVLAEVMGLDEFRDRVKIYATDVDEEALTAARHATYTARQVQGVPADLLEKYFERIDGSFVFHKDLRRQVIFGRHDLITDAPISRIDLLVCRNTLMYFNAETQAKILMRFHFALNSGGFLFLGRAETLMTHGQTFAPVDLKRRVSRKIARGAGRDRGPAAGAGNVTEGDRLPPSTRIRDAALDASPVAQLVLNPAGQIVFVNDRARLLFNLRSADVGCPLQDLQLSYRPVELRSVIEQAESERRPVTVKEIEWRSPAGEARWLDLHIAPLTDALGGLLGMSVTFTDVTAYRRLQ